MHALRASEMQQKPIMLHSDLPVSAPAGVAVPIPYGSDEMLIRLWLNGRSPHTQAAYEADARAMLATVGKPIAAVTLADLQAWTGTLAFAAMAPASRARKIGAVKSLLTFAERTGLLPFNVGDRRKVGGQAATAIGGCGSLVGRNFCPKPVPSVPL